MKHLFSPVCGWVIKPLMVEIMVTNALSWEIKTRRWKWIFESWPKLKLPRVCWGTKADSIMCTMDMEIGNANVYSWRVFSQTPGKRKHASSAQHNLLLNTPSEIADRKMIALHKHNWFRTCFQASIPWGWSVKQTWNCIIHCEETVGVRLLILSRNEI